MRWLAFLAAALAALASASAASARTNYCSPTGDYCTSTLRQSGAVYLRVSSFAFKGRVRICVADPKARGVCHTFPLSPRRSGVHEAKVRWRGNYPNGGKGVYKVRFYYGTTRLGPVLSFRIT